MIPRYQVAFWRIALARRKGEQVPTRQSVVQNEEESRGPPGNP